jgi:hypothetical protein
MSLVVRPCHPFQKRLIFSKRSLEGLLGIQIGDWMVTKTFADGIQAMDWKKATTECTHRDFTRLRKLLHDARGHKSHRSPPKVLCRRTENYLFVQLAVEKVAPKQPISLVAYRKTGPAKRKTPVWPHYSRQRSLSTAKRPTSVRKLMGGGRGRRDDRRLYYSGSLLHFSIEMDAQDNLLALHSRIRHGGRFPWLDSEAS